MNIAGRVRWGFVAAWVVVLCAGGAAWGAQDVWRIGEVDRDYHDLCFSGDVNTFLRDFPKDVDFVVGQSDPQKAFSALHPSGSLHWAGRRRHPFKIRFAMPEAPHGVYELRLDFVDTSYGRRPMLAVDVNGRTASYRLESGTRGIAFMRPEHGKASTARFCFGADVLKQGENTITLTVTDGEWALYDALALRRLDDGEAAAVSCRVEPTIFYVEGDEGLRQELSLAVQGLMGDGPTRVTVRAGDAVIGEATLPTPALGIVTGAVRVKEASSPRTVQVEVFAGGASATVTAEQRPTKKWRIYCAPSTHTDIGYTNDQEKVIALHNRNTDLALELARAFPLYHWNLESSWAAQMWFRDRPRYRYREFYAASKARRVGIESTYLNMLTGLCSGEELIRNLYYSARIHRKYGIPFESATITDAPSHVWSVPSVLAGAGIRCLSIGSNQTRAPVLKQNIHHKCPFWWEGPDGARVLTWMTVGYSQAGRIGLKDGMERMRDAIEQDLYWWTQREDYPYDAILLHGAYSDNVSIGKDIAESITRYAKHYAYPKVILCANDDFFEYIEANFADAVPVVRGGGGSWWEDGAASTARETGMNRRAHEDLVTAEVVWASVKGSDAQASVPQGRFNDLWDAVLLFDEHTWGAYCSITRPESDFTQRQWAYKASFADKASRGAKRLLKAGLRRLASRVEAPNGSVLVFNPSGRARSGVVQIEIPRGHVVVDGEQEVPQQVLSKDALTDQTVAFTASDVPAIGYKTFRVVARKEEAAPFPSRVQGNVMENEHYKVVLDPATGAISSLFDKKLGKELLDTTSAYQMGQMVYAAGGGMPDGRTQVECPDRSRITDTSPKNGTVEIKTAGPVMTKVKFSSQHDQFRWYEVNVILYEHAHRVDFLFRMNKKMTYEKEAMYLAFPIAGANPRFQYAVGAGAVRPNEDQFPGACRDWFSVQRWVTVNTDDVGVIWSPLDTPLISLCDMNAGKWLDTLPITNGTVFAYAMNNYWFTNYKAGQDDEFEFQYCVTSAKAVDKAEAAVFGEDVASPMRAVRVHGSKASGLPNAASFCEIVPSTVSLMTLKPADDGRGIILRVRETAGKKTNVRIRLAFTGLTRASRCDLVERDRGSIACEGGVIALELGANAMQTIRLE